jgi:rhodanese-related sulfurtransferase
MLLLAWLACSTPEAPPTAAPAGHLAPAPVAATVRQTDAAGLKAAMDAHQVRLLIDVRSPEEYAAGHVPGAVLLPLPELQSRLAEITPHKDEEVFVICEVGGRSARASALLAAEGFRPVNVDGGTRAWREAGLPVEP